jgi:hypothetical protein
MQTAATAGRTLAITAIRSCSAESTVGSGSAETGVLIMPSAAALPATPAAHINGFRKY